MPKTISILTPGSTAEFDEAEGVLRVYPNGTGEAPVVLSVPALLRELPRELLEGALADAEKHLGPWEELPRGPLGTRTEVRYPVLSDRFWELDGSRWWAVAIHPCCSGEKRHFTWMLSDPPLGRRSGSEKTREEARAAAEGALREAGWTFS